MEPVPTWAWLVGPLVVVSGELSIEDRALVLRDGDRTTRVPLRELGEVRRLRWTPVLRLVRRRHPAVETLLLYFAEPPSSGSWERETMGAPKSGLERTANMLRLRSADKERKPLVRAWEEAIRKAAGS